MQKYLIRMRDMKKMDKKIMFHPDDEKLVELEPYIDEHLSTPPTAHRIAEF